VPVPALPRYAEWLEKVFNAGRDYVARGSRTGCVGNGARIAGRDHRFEVKLEVQETVLREFLSATVNGDLDRLAKVLAGDATLVCDGENLGAPAPPPVHGAAAISSFLVEKAREWMRSGARLQKTAIREVPLLFAYCDGKLLNALALIFQGGQVQTIYVVACPVRLRSLSVQCPPPDGGKDNIL
jgi:hypothetical protein